MHKHHPETLAIIREEKPIDGRSGGFRPGRMETDSVSQRQISLANGTKNKTGTHHGHVVAHVHDRLEPGEHRRRVLHVFHDHDDLERSRVPGVLAGLRVHVQRDHLQPVHVSGLEVQRPGHGYRAGGRVLVGARPADDQLRRALRSHRRCKRQRSFTFTRRGEEGKGAKGAIGRVISMGTRGNMGCAVVTFYIQNGADRPAEIIALMQLKLCFYCCRYYEFKLHNNNRIKLNTTKRRLYNSR